MLLPDQMMQKRGRRYSDEQRKRERERWKWRTAKIRLPLILFVFCFPPVCLFVYYTPFFFARTILHIRCMLAIETAKRSP